MAPQVSFSYRSRVYYLQTDQSSSAWQGKPLGELGARLTLSNTRSGLDIGIYGTNLANARSVTNEGNTFNYPLASFNPPRTVGLFLDKKF